MRERADKAVHCLNHERVPEAGLLEVQCLDKTGTITEGSLDLLGAIGYSQERSSWQDASAPNNLDTVKSRKEFEQFKKRVEKFDETVDKLRNNASSAYDVLKGVEFSPKSCPSNSSKNSNNSAKEEMCSPSMFDAALTTCHTLTKIEKTGELVGNEVEKEMFKMNEAIQMEDSVDAVTGATEKLYSFNCEKSLNKIEAMKTKAEFPFCKTKQLQSVVVEVVENNVEKNPNEDSEGPLSKIFRVASKEYKNEGVDSILSSKNSNDEMNAPNMYVFAKGSCEKLTKICRKDSLPKDLETKVRKLAESGIYVLAMAGRLIDTEDPKNSNLFIDSERNSDGTYSQKFSENDALCASIGDEITTATPSLSVPRKSSSKLSVTTEEKFDRDTVEKDLTFLGLLCFENRLRPCSTQAIAELKSGGILPIILTGDNGRTGLHVARECGLVESKADVIFADLTEVEKDNSLDRTATQEEGVLAKNSKRTHYVSWTLTRGERSMGSPCENSANICEKLNALEASYDSKFQNENEVSIDVLNVTKKSMDLKKNDKKSTSKNEGRVKRANSIASMPKKRCYLLENLKFLSNICSLFTICRRKRGNMKKPVDKLLLESADQIYDELSMPVKDYNENIKNAPYFALTEEVLNELRIRNPELLAAILPRVAIWGRMTPNGKAWMIRYWQRNLGKVVGMVGDGGNDCAALQQAHVGMAMKPPSQSETEANEKKSSGNVDEDNSTAAPTTKKASKAVAKSSDASMVAAFSTTSESLLALCTLVRHGRCCVVNCSATYKFWTVGLLLYYSLKQYLLIADGSYNAEPVGLAMVLAYALVVLAMPSSKPVDSLYKSAPPVSLLGMTWGGHVAWIYGMTMAMFQLIFVIFFKSNSWYHTFNYDVVGVASVTIDKLGGELGRYFGTSVMWGLAGLGITLAFALGDGKYRRGVFFEKKISYMNWRIGLIFVPIAIGMTLFAVFESNSWLNSLMMFSNTNKSAWVNGGGKSWLGGLLQGTMGDQQVHSMRFWFSDDVLFQDKAYFGPSVAELYSVEDGDFRKKQDEMIVFGTNLDEYSIISEDGLRELMQKEHEYTENAKKEGKSAIQLLAIAKALGAARVIHESGEEAMDDWKNILGEKSESKIISYSNNLGGTKDTGNFNNPETQKSLSLYAEQLLFQVGWKASFELVSMRNADKNVVKSSSRSYFNGSGAHAIRISFDKSGGTDFFENQDIQDKRNMSISPEGFEAAQASFYCQELCAATWNHGSQDQDPARFYCWYSLISLDNEKCILVPRMSYDGHVGLGPDLFEYLRFTIDRKSSNISDDDADEGVVVRVEKSNGEDNGENSKAVTIDTNTNSKSLTVEQDMKLNVMNFKPGQKSSALVYPLKKVQAADPHNIENIATENESKNMGIRLPVNYNDMSSYEKSTSFRLFYANMHNIPAWHSADFTTNSETTNTPNYYQHRESDSGPDLNWRVYYLLALFACGAIQVLFSYKLCY